MVQDAHMRLQPVRETHRLNILTLLAASVIQRTIFHTKRWGFLFHNVEVSMTLQRLNNHLGEGAPHLVQHAPRAHPPVSFDGGGEVACKPSCLLHNNCLGSRVACDCLVRMPRNLPPAVTARLSWTIVRCGRYMFSGLRWI